MGNTPSNESARDAAPFTGGSNIHGPNRSSDLSKKTVTSLGYGTSGQTSSSSSSSATTTSATTTAAAAASQPLPIPGKMTEYNDTNEKKLETTIYPIPPMSIQFGSPLTNTSLDFPDSRISGALTTTATPMQVSYLSSSSSSQIGSTRLSSSVTEDSTSTPVIVSVPMVLTWSSGGKKVSVIGTFTNWKEKIPLTKM
jgi:hypothetical protein